MSPAATTNNGLIGRGKNDVDREVNITREELNRIEECMQNPEFLKLFEEYANEISDPEALRETDLYIKQLEKEGGTLPNAIVVPRAVCSIYLNCLY